MGEFVLIFNETSEMIQKMSIPQMFNGFSTCFVNEPIKWLVESRSECRYTPDLEQLIESWDQIKFLKYPVVSSMEYHCTNESCANVTISREYRNQSFSGVDVVRVELVLWHNFTHIVDGVEINVTYTNYEEKISKGQIVVEFELVFKSSEEKYLEKFPPMSGMPGYVKLMPVLTSKKVTFSNYTQENKEYVLDFYVFNNRSEPYNANRTLKIPVSRQRKCVLTSVYHKLINFGEISYHKCHAHLHLSHEISSNTNFTDLCQTYQNQIFSLLLNSHDFQSNNFTSNTYISQLGHPKNSTDDWVLLKFINSPNLDQESVTGNWRQDTKNSFTCSNMVINIKYEFFYAQLRVAGVDYQNIIKEAQVNFGPRLDLHFSISDVSVPVFITTQFYDLTRMSNRATERISGSLIYISVVVIFIKIVCGC